ncbi:hypothetical protein COU54_05165 [Candidatus Pacearchaeota archaeon CG10_big_fil_rev_8_21_14_0_10_31_24]|nr:MAG: hypothetical protein COU54_05165 [Candidatus Pacearchaeota archaeon CG10_big_fil_rev_8_21_14_0_10_31_24]
MEQEILSSFTNKNQFSFNDLSKLLKIRTNKLAYHLKKLSQKGLVKKQNSLYELTEQAESKIPYFSEKSSPIPIILIELKNKSAIFLHKRNKRPYKDLYGLPGGRILVGESLQQATKRIMLSKFNIKINSLKLKSISLEHLKKSNTSINSFILITMQAKTSQKINYLSLERIKSQIISSDYKIIKQKPQKTTLKTIITKS